MEKYTLNFGKFRQYDKKFITEIDGSSVISVAFSGETLYDGYTVGNRKICPVSAETDVLEIQILSARDTVDLKEITVYKV